MTQDEKKLLFKDLCARLPYGVKILYEGWDSDRDTDYNTMETLIGIDTDFIHTIVDKTGNNEKHSISVLNWKPYLRLMSSITEEEKKLLNVACCFIGGAIKTTSISAIAKTSSALTWICYKYHLDINGLIEKGLALEAPEDMYKFD